MAHRIYVYNVSKNGKEKYSELLAEWNYVIPLLLMPLFFASPRVKGSLLYFDREAGIANLHRFYDLLGESYELTYKACFYEPRRQMFEVLENLPFACFEMDASDVFNMNEESHKEQAQQWVEDIQQIQGIFEQALESRDLSLLNEEVAKTGYESFRDILETDWIQYGLGYWEKSLYQHAAESFESNGLWGLKNRKGEVILEPQFSQLWVFNDEGIAVFLKDEKYGYIRDTGQIVLEAQFSEAFDTFSHESINYAVVQPLHAPEKQGLICADTGKWMLPPVYDAVDQLVYTDCFNVLLDDQYQLRNFQNEQVIQQSSAVPFEMHYLSADAHLYFCKQKGSAKRQYFQSNGEIFGEYMEDILSALSPGLIQVSPHKFQRKISVLNADGSVLLDEVDELKMWSDHYRSFVYRKQKKWHVYDTVSQSFLLPEGCDKLLNDAYIHFLKDVYLFENAGKYGLYDAQQHQWLIPMENDFSKIEYTDTEFFRCTATDGMRYYDAEQKYLSDLFDCIAPALDRYFPEFSQLTLYKGTQLYTINLQREVQQLTAEQVGQYYLKRFSFRGKDLKFFERFYQQWIEAQGTEYLKFFDADTLFQMAKQYQEKGCIDEALQYFQLAASKGHSESMVEAGLIYDDHEAFCNKEQAFSYYEQAAQLGNSWGWNNMGCLYLNGQGVVKDSTQAVMCFEQSMQLGNGQAYKNLAGLYYDGIDVEKNVELATRYYEQAEKRFYFCGEQLADLYYDAQDYKKVLKIIKRDNDEGYTAIYFALMHEGGIELKKNTKKAIQYFEQSLGYAEYYYALNRLLHYYGESDQFKNKEKYERWKSYIEENGIQLGE